MSTPIHYCFTPSWRCLPYRDATVWARGTVATQLHADNGAPVPPLADLIATVCDDGGAVVVEYGSNTPAGYPRNEVVIIQDLIRSCPVLFSRQKDICIGDDLSAWQHPLRRDHASEREFMAMGFVPGVNTLYDDVYQTLQGTTTRIALSPSPAPATSEDGCPGVVELPTGVTIDDWGRLEYSSDRIDDPREYQELFDAAYSASLERSLEQAGSHRVVVPLSGGLDSRLLISSLYRLGVEPVTFTYGTPGSRESVISRQIAEAAGFDWHMVPYPRHQVQARFHEPDRADFLTYCHAGVSLPHIQDWFALEHLLAEEIIRPGDVLFPGHTWVGNMHNPEVLDSSGPISTGAVARAIAHHHYCLQGKADRPESNPRYLAHMRSFLSPCDGSARMAQSAIEAYNVRERQAKYINNSVRVYEFYGLGWQMPMLSERVFTAVQQAGPRCSLTRQWYADYIAERLQRDMGSRADNIPLYQGIVMSEGQRSRVKQILEATHLLPVAERAYTVRANLTDSTGLDAFITDRSRAHAAWNLSRGQAMMGLWARAFIQGRWSRAQR